MRTEIATLGEFGLIRHLTENIELKHPSTRYGVGDDAAVLSYPADRDILVTTDLLLEGVHFDLTYVPLKHLGYKAAVVNFSDIYAMNGSPRQITVSLGLSKRFCIEDMDELYAGIRLACEAYDVDIVGGDTSSSLTGLTISITCIGEADRIFPPEAQRAAWDGQAEIRTLPCGHWPFAAIHSGREEGGFSWKYLFDS